MNALPKEYEYVVQDYSYYSEPKEKEKKGSLDEVDPELLRTFERLGIPLNEQKRLANVAVDAVFDSVSIHTTFKKELLDVGIIFCSISEAVRDYPDLVKKHLGSVVSSKPPYLDIASAGGCLMEDWHSYQGACMLSTWQDLVKIQ